MDVQAADPDALAEALFGTDERAMRASMPLPGVPMQGSATRQERPISCIL